LFIHGSKRVPIHRELPCSVLLQQQQKGGASAVVIRETTPRASARTHKVIRSRLVVKIIAIGQVTGQREFRQKITANHFENVEAYAGFRYSGGAQTRFVRRNNVLRRGCANNQIRVLNHFDIRDVPNN